MLRKLEGECSKWGLAINMLQTEHLVVGDKAEGLRIGTDVIKGTENFKYLRVRVTSTAGSNEETTSRIEQLLNH